VILNKDADKDLHVTLNFGAGKSGSVQIETLRAPALDSREAHIAPSAAGRLRNGSYSVSVPRASGLRVTIKA